MLASIVLRSRHGIPCGCGQESLNGEFLADRPIYMMLMLGIVPAQ